MTPDDTKDALKEALKEWLDEKFAAFGRWSLGAIGSTVVVALAYFLLQFNGWHRVP